MKLHNPEHSGIIVQLKGEDFKPGETKEFSEETGKNILRNCEKIVDITIDPDENLQNLHWYKKKEKIPQFLKKFIVYLYKKYV